MVHRNSTVQRAAAGLRAARLDAGVNPTVMAAALGIATETYRMYERGATPIRVDQLPLLAEALNLTVPDLLGRLGLLDAPAWSAFDALTEAGVPEAEAREQAEFVEGRPEIDQRAYVRAYLDLWRTQGAESTQNGNCRRPA